MTDTVEDMGITGLAASKCFYCREGHKPMISQSAVEHWVVTRVLPAKVTIKPCKDPDLARAALSPPVTK